MLETSCNQQPDGNVFTLHNVLDVLDGFDIHHPFQSPNPWLSLSPLHCSILDMLSPSFSNIVISEAWYCLQERKHPMAVEIDV